MSAPQVPDYYAIVDFECTTREERKGWNFEIIEWPVVFLNSETKEVDFEFHRYVKPTQNPVLTDFAIQLTGISQDTVDQAETVDVVIKELEEFLNERQLVLLANRQSENDITFVWASDGFFDFNDFLFVEADRKNIELPDIFGQILDVRFNFKTITGRGGNLKAMLDFYNLEFDGREHSGIDDARNITKILLKLLEKNNVVIETKWEIMARAKRQRVPKPDDWICPECQEINFAHRQTCFGCNIPRPPGLGFPRYRGRVGRGRWNRGRSDEPEWTCVACNFSNWATRGKCFKCQTPRPNMNLMYNNNDFRDNGAPNNFMQGGFVQQQMQMQLMHGGFPPQQLAYMQNFAPQLMHPVTVDASGSENDSEGHQAPLSPGQMDQYAGAMQFPNPFYQPLVMNQMGMHQQAMYQHGVAAPTYHTSQEGQTTYWTCHQCGTCNFHAAKECHGCGEAWTCGKCQFLNFAFRSQCMRCRTPKTTQLAQTAQALPQQVAQAMPEQTANEGREGQTGI